MKLSSLSRVGICFLLLSGLSALGQTAASGPQNGIQSSSPENAAMSGSMSSSANSADQPSNAGTTANQAPMTQEAPNLSSRDPRYRINKTDSMNVNFLFTPEYDQQVTVQPDGFVTMRGVGDVKVEGETVPEVVHTLEMAYGKLLHEPVITVLMTNVVPAYFIAGGEVKSPGRYNFAGDTTVTQAISIAGGFTSYAKHSQVILFRRVNNEWVEGRRIDVKHMIKDAELAEDLHLQAGDMLYVPKNFISKTEPWLTPFSQFIKLGLFGNYPLHF